MLKNSLKISYITKRDIFKVHFFQDDKNMRKVPSCRFQHSTSIKCLIDRSFKICNNWTSFHNDIENIKSNLIKNAYPPSLIDKIIKKYLNYKFSCNPNQLKDKSDVHYFKLPYIGNLSHHIKNKLSKLCKEFCKENFNIKLVFNKSLDLMQNTSPFFNNPLPPPCN